MGLITATDSIKSTTNIATAGADTQVLAANSERNGLSINVDAAGTGTVYVLLGTGVASATNFHFSMAPGAQWNGKISDVVWRGAVRLFSAGTPKVSIVEI